MASFYDQLEASAHERVEAARTLAEQIASPAAAAVDSDARFPDEAVAALAAEGFLGLCVAKEYGGAGHAARVFAAVAEALGEACSSTAMIYVMHVAAAQAVAASKQLKNREVLLREIAAGKHLTTLAFSEQGSRSQFWAPVSRLEENSAGNGFTTSAMKSWVTAAGHADSYVASAQRPAAESPLESTLYLVLRTASGLSISGRFDGLGLRGNESAPVQLDGIAVAADDLITEPGGGADMMLQVVLPWFCIGTAAMSHGLCLAAVSATAGHLSQAGFEHTGGRLRDLPNLRARLAQMSVRTQQARALLGLALTALETSDEHAALHVLQARLAALEAAVDVTDLAMKTCGGAAFSRQLGIERLFRDARAGWVMAPTVDHLSDFIGRSLTGLPLL